MKTGRKQTPAAEIIDVPMNEPLLASDHQALNSLALATAQQDSAVRAVALQMGYQLPADCTDPDLIQRDISANMRRSVEACLEVGKGLRVLKVACAHGNFMSRLDVLGIEASVARRFMDTANKFSKRATSHVLGAAGGQSKLFEMLILDSEQIEELELTGQTGELALDAVATMSVKELRKACREAKLEKDATDKLLATKDAKINKLSRHIAKTTPDQKQLELQKEATELMNDALGCVRGQMRNAFHELASHYIEHDGKQPTVFMAGLLGQLQADLTALREEFNLPDVSNAADLALAAEVDQWAK